MAIREGSCYNNGKKLVKRMRAIKYYSHCGEKGHNFYTCIVEIKNINNSNTFKE